MRREDFVSTFVNYIIKRSVDWLAEADTEEGHLANMQDELNYHHDVIKKVLKNGRDTTPDNPKS